MTRADGSSTAYGLATITEFDQDGEIIAQTTVSGAWDVNKIVYAAIASEIAVAD